jgi:RNA polymerase sigma factor (sigma-70 family)
MPRRVVSETLLERMRSMALASSAVAASDRELTERFADRRDEIAFSALVRRHGQMVLGVCRRVLGHEQDAEDAFQATFLILSRKAAALRDKETVGPWLFGVAHRVSLRARQQAKSRRERESKQHERFGTDLLGELSVREAQAVLDAEIAALPESQRAPLILCYLEGFTRDEAARRLGCPLGTLKSRLERAKAALQRRLTRRGLTLAGTLSLQLLIERSACAVPSALQACTIKNGLVFASGSLSSATASSTAVALAEGALALSPLGKLRIPALLTFAVLASSTVAGFFESAPAPSSRGQDDQRGQVVRQAALEQEPLQDKRADQPSATEKPKSLQASRFLDLQAHANQPLSSDFANMKGNNLANLPLGEQVFAGTKFNIGAGVIQLTGRAAPQPQKIEGIKVSANFRILNILHATQWALDNKKDVVAYYIVNYDDKSRQGIPIVYGTDVRNWWSSECEGPCRAEVAWKGTNDVAERTSGATLRLYVTRWTNPAPDRKVASIDFVAAHAEVAPFSVAMTIEE